jgi:hypothetical protein
MQMPPRFPAVVLAALLATFCFRSYRTYRVFNDTADEAAHIACGLEVWRTGRYTIETQHPPLARIVLGFPAYLAGLQSTVPGELWLGQSLPAYWNTLSASRAANLIFVPFLVVYVYRWGRELHGQAAGLIAAVLAGFCPNLLAHASVAALDFAAASTTFLASYHFWRWSRQPGWRNCLLSAFTFGLAALTKFSALFFLPPVAAGFFVIARWRRRPWIPSLRRGAVWKRGAVFLAVFALTVWSGYLFDFAPLPPARIFAPPHSLVQRATSAVEMLAGSRKIPAPGFVRGILEVLSHDADGHPCYLLGRQRNVGWWYYFPLALAVKSTLPLLTLAAMGTGVWAAARGKGRAASTVYPLLAAAAVLGVCMSSKLNLGIRHILVIYPFFALLAAGAFAGRQRILTALAAALVMWHLGESLFAHPDYLAYFNEIARGREERFLADSNLDWGQDLERLHEFMAEKRISTIYLSYFGRTDPHLLGIHFMPLGPGLFPSGWVAVSKNHLAGVGRDRSDLAFLKGHTPAAQVGKSILVYHLPAHG